MSGCLLMVFGWVAQYIVESNLKAAALKARFSEEDRYAYAAKRQQAQRRAIVRIHKELNESRSNSFASA